MKKKYFKKGWVLIIILISSCSVTYQTQNITQPILLNKKIGVPSVDIPGNAKLVENIEGKILQFQMISGGNSIHEWKTDANVDFTGTLGTIPNRFVADLNFKVSDYVFWWTGGQAQIKYNGVCYELPSK